MEISKLDFKFYSDDLCSNRKRLFQDALKAARNGKVLYIMCDELEELPQLSQELNSINRQYMKMISFLYAKSLESLIESLTSLPDWQYVPSTIILDDLSTYCNKKKLHLACGVLSLLIDSVRSCSKSLGATCSLYVSVTKAVVDENYINVLRELYLN